jgi:hypothetical protein
MNRRASQELTADEFDKWLDEQPAPLEFQTCKRCGYTSNADATHCRGCSRPLGSPPPLRVELKNGQTLTVEAEGQSLTIESQPDSHEYPGYITIHLGSFQYLAGSDEGKYAELHGPAMLCDAR